MDRSTPDVDHDFARFRRTGDPDARARVFDAVAGQDVQVSSSRVSPVMGVRVPLQLRRGQDHAPVVRLSAEQRIRWRLQTGPGFDWSAIDAVGDCSYSITDGVRELQVPLCRRDAGPADRR
jgi:hypothetical protein